MKRRQQEEEEEEGCPILSLPDDIMIHLIDYYVGEDFIRLFFCCQYWNRFFMERMPWDVVLQRWYHLTLQEGTLAAKNEIPDDKHIVFDEPTHLYTIRGIIGGKFVYRTHRPKTHPEYEKGLLSVTGFKKTLFPDFNKVAATQAIRKSWQKAIEARDRALPYRPKRWVEEKLIKYETTYGGKTDEEIWASWESERDDASRKGTLAHKNQENFLNNLAYDESLPEFLIYRPYYESMVAEGRLRPWRTELSIFDLELNLCGQVDVLYEFVKDEERYDSHGRRRLVMGDWKRCKRIRRENRFESGIKPLTEKLPHCEYQEFRFQLGPYSAIMERRYNAVILEPHIFAMHPDFIGERMISLDISNRDKALIIRHRRQELLG